MACLKVRVMWKNNVGCKAAFLLFLAVLTMGNFGRLDKAQAITCSFNNAPATLSFGTILSGNSGSMSGSMGFQCSAGLLELTSAMCPTIEPALADMSGTTRLLHGTSGAALGYALAFNLYLPGNLVWGMRTVSGSGTIPQQTALLPVLGTSYTQPFTGSIAAGQVVPAGTYSTTSRYTTYFTSGLIAPILLGSCFNSGQNITSAVTITAIIQPNCNVSANDINFGTQTVLTQTLSAQGAIIVNCTLAQPYSVSLASSTGMRMMNGSQSIQYGLFSDPAYQSSWNGTTAINGVGIGSNQTIPVYARVLPQQTPSAGTYSDTVAITVTY
ncbi:MAG: Secreted pili protein involved in motility and biofilm formation [Candidatus Tokpelaia hoelldobleri]|uniref:Secreted pili protein involved in motility and biofilm formation n=1 Tax=Candidatus Tokpelaia hoelldobleri TaxID=1902579 RepID=A0A1U9JVJ3_9HYPH|nr:MAG: Secreted pili protein involved in motility and biofilm formation [Candidatus Tokpelaia hoelldoblerii]